MSDTTNFQAAAYTARGTARDKVTLPETLFDGTVNVPVMHQAVKAYLANQRQANAHTKNRKVVAGGNQKPWKQKGTGRARQGSTRAPHFVGGGTVFGPTNERNYKQDVPRQIRQLARKSALNARAIGDALFVIDRFDYDAPNTKQMLALVDRLGAVERKVLVLTDGVKPNVYLSGRNIPNVHVMPYADASTYHILWSDVVLVEAGAIGQALEPVAETEAAPKAKAPKAAKPAKAEKAAKAPAKKTAAKKTAAKKTAAKKTATKSAAKKAPTKKAAAKKSATTTKKKGK